MPRSYYSLLYPRSYVYDNPATYRYSDYVYPSYSRSYLYDYPSAYRYSDYVYPSYSRSYLYDYDYYPSYYDYPLRSSYYDRPYYRYDYARDYSYVPSYYNYPSYRYSSPIVEKKIYDYSPARTVSTHYSSYYSPSIRTYYYWSHKWIHIIIASKHKFFFQVILEYLERYKLNASYNF